MTVLTRMPITWQFTNCTRRVGRSKKHEIRGINLHLWILDPFIMERIPDFLRLFGGAEIGAKGALNFAHFLISMTLPKF